MPKADLIRVYLKYTSDRKPIISGIQRVSTPGRRKYVGVDELPVLRRGLGKTVVSTSKGVMSAEESKTRKYGWRANLLCLVETERR